MADENTVPYIRVLHWIYSTTTGLYSDWSVCSCQNIWWTCQNFAVLKSRNQNPCSQTLIAGNQCSLGVQNERLEYTRLFVCGRRNRRVNIITGMRNNRKWEIRGVKRIKEEWPKESWIRHFAIVVNLASWCITCIYLTSRGGVHKKFLVPLGSKFSDLLFLGCTKCCCLGWGGCNSKYWYFYEVILIKMHILTYFLLI